MKTTINYLPLTFLLLFFYTNPLFSQKNDQYLVGCGKTDITYIIDSLGLFGFGEYHQRIDGKNGATSPLYSRTIIIQDPETNERIIYLHADLGAIFHSLRTGLTEKIKENLYPNFNESSLIMTASHTHCAAAGMSHYALYMATAPGYNPELVEFTVNQMYESVKMASENPILCSIELKEGEFAPDEPVAFNRALKSYNANPDIPRKYDKTETNLALNRNMPLISFVDKNGENRGFINWFGVHPIELWGDYNFLDGASKGYAGIYAEEQMDSFDVAIFAQSGAGDVMTCDFHNHESFEEKMKVILNDENYTHEGSNLQLSRWNGQQQAYKALQIRDLNEKITINGKIDHELIYIDLSKISVDDDFANGEKNAQTTSPVLGTPFLSPMFYYNDKNKIRTLLNCLANFSRMSYAIKSPFVKKEKRKYRKNLYKNQKPKKLAVNGEENSIFGVELKKYHKRGFGRLFFNIIKKVDLVIAETVRQTDIGAMGEHTILPVILPIQLVRIGNVVIAGIPTEITTVAHNRLHATLLEILKKDGVEKVLISSYANEYAGYTTTYQEFLQQRYEAGHTLYGRHQLGAFQTEFKKLAEALLLPKNERNLNYDLRPPVFSEEELGRRSGLKPLKK